MNRNHRESSGALVPGDADTGNREICICVDAMGADFEPVCAVAAAAAALGADDRLTLQVVGDAAALDPALAGLSSGLSARIERIASTEFIAMASSPAEALRHGRASSMAQALDRVAEGAADAVVSSGNTGALMALARYRLGTLPGIERPALMTELPVVGGSAWVLDLGANISVDAERLTEFAVLGSAAVGALLKRKPRVGLLNIGSESNKGPDVVREAARRCAATDIDLVGFVEGHDVFAGAADVVVCDGFAGNVLLKSAEGAIAMLLGEIDKAGSRMFAGPGLRSLRKRMKSAYDPARHNGASLLGISGIVIKSHAHASVEGIAHAIGVAALEVRRGMLPELERQLWANV
ncbi:MAG TPA: phosphate acyltransferase PlsX [Wenzhouxiangellaceae bacterium]|nr:phosphate acyltransferase PlsX [Wenzhouxiangellaceae bacterium]